MVAEFAAPPPVLQIHGADFFLIVQFVIDPIQNLPRTVLVLFCFVIAGYRPAFEFQAGFEGGLV
ncbi:hypothetical protein D3C86_1690560 [compost metagenome]